VIGKDVLANLEKSKGGEDTYLMNYVEELKKVTYNQSVMEFMNCHSPIYCITKLSTFRWCVNSKLLRKHNLICPDDYISNPPLPIKKMEKTAPKKPSWYRSRIQEEEELAKYEEKKNFLKNPRSLPPNVQGGGKSLIIPKMKVEKMNYYSNTALLSLSKSSVSEYFFHFVVFIVVFQTNLELRNLTSASRHVRVIPPCTQYFSIGLGKFPGEGGMVAPGMSCQYTVRFIPDCLADFEDFILIETQAPFPLIVPIEARRPPPILTLPRVLDCGYCLVGGVKFTEFLCRNEGLSPGRFCIMSKKQWPAANFRSVATPGFVEKPPFALGPFFFELLPGEATLLEVAFLPPSPEAFSEVFTIVCDNCQVKEITVTGSGELVALQLTSITGGEDSPYPEEITDLSANHFVRFEPLNPHSVARKTIVIHNAT
uniref:DLEC1 cilia and flagella associated protein n=1 Tax=Erpetoichthys calabaricus TaxID=27687 RepID=A0A8C4SDU0_ERPCA